MQGRLRALLVGKTAVSGPKGLGRGEVTADKLEEIAPGLWWQIALDDEKAMGELEALRKQFDDARKRLDRRFEDKVDKLQRGDELPPGVMKMVKVFVAVKRKLQPGDKMAAVTATRASSPRSCRSRTCRTSRTAPTWTSC
jgi:DNA-directed RNA polymerase subunit beta